MIMPAADGIDLHFDGDRNRLAWGAAILIRHGGGKRVRVAGFDGGSFRCQREGVWLLNAACSTGIEFIASVAGARSAGRMGWAGGNSNTTCCSGVGLVCGVADAGAAA